MIAVDTNIVIRYLIEDDERQTAQAKALIESADVFVPITVLLEAEWVLRGAYDVPRVDVVKALRAFAGLPHVSVEDPARLGRALDWTISGMDFADALHLASVDQCEAFVTFDRSFVKSAQALASCPVRVP